MLHPEHYLNDYDRSQTALRIVNDAELIKRGATISTSGVLVLGSCQSEYISHYNELLYTDPLLLINEAEPESSLAEVWLAARMAQPHAYFDSRIKDQLFNSPEVFAARFETERRKLEYDHFV